MNPRLAPLDMQGILFLITSLVFGLFTLYALFAISRNVLRGPAERGAATIRQRRRAFLEELIWIAVPVLLLLWLWRAI